jgi:hypothetical protein
MMVPATSISTLVLGTNYLAVVVAAAAAFVQGSVWYVVFGKQWVELRDKSASAGTALRPEPKQMLAQFARDLVVAYVLARFVVLLGVVDLVEAVYLAAWVWLGFQATAVLGAVIHESYPPKLFAIHAGDALVKTVLMTAILAVWR